MPLNRRLFLGSLSASIFALPLSAEEAAKDAKPAPDAKPAEAAAPNPDGFRQIEARKTSLQLLPAPAAATEAFGFDGSVPGPLLRVKMGEEIKIRLNNQLDSPISLHWHGMRVPSAMDGVANLTQTPVGPKQSFDYRFTPPDSGLFWYHPTSLPLPEGQQDHGLYGVFIVDEPEPPKVDAERLLILDDWRLDDKSAIVNDPKAPSTALITMNGATAASEETFQPGSRIRLRLLSAASERLLAISLTGVKLQVIGIDGQPCEPLSLRARPYR